MNIGEAARLSGVSAKMIRHYEQKGLLKPAARSEAGYRQYNQKTINELCFIRQARNLGFSISQINMLLGLHRDPNRASKAVQDLAREHLAEVKSKRRELAAMEHSLTAMIAACPGNENPHCSILDELANRKK